MLDSWFVTVASHTINHFDLTKISKKNKESEICDSKRDLENAFWIKINTLVYPSGKYDEDTIRFAKSCGYSYGFASLNKSIFSEDLKNKPFELTRLRVNRKSEIENIFSFWDNISVTQKPDDNKIQEPPKQQPWVIEPTAKHQPQQKNKK